MLDTFRKYSNSSLIYLMFGALIFVFAVSFGPGSKGCTTGSIQGSTSFAAKVNDDSISVRDFNQTYSRVYNDYQERGGGAFTPELADQLHLKDMVLDRLIERDLLVQAAKRHGLAVGDEELAQAIAKIGAFQRNGAFDHDQYRMMVERELNTTPSAFEEQMRRDLLSQKMLALVKDSATATDDEVKAAYLKDHDKADLEFVRFSPSQLMGEVKVSPSSAELERYAKDHAAEVADFYQRHTARYHKPQRVQARHILAKVDEGAPAEEQAKAKAKIEQAQAELKAGKDFAEVAKALSDDPGSKDKGGDLGAFGPGTMAKPFEDAAFKLAPGQVSDIVKTRFGYHLIKVEKVLPPEDKKLDEVKRDIALELMKDAAAKTLAQAKADEAEKAIQEGKKLAELYPAADKPTGAGAFAFAAQKPEAQDTGPFAAGDFVPKIGPAPEIAQAAFQLTLEKPTGPRVFELGGAFYVISLKSREKPSGDDFKAHQAEIRKQVVDEKQQGLVSAFLKELRASAKIQKNQSVLAPSASREAGA